jgi:hypothetical protein
VDTFFQQIGTGLEYGRHRGQAIISLIGSYAYNAFPLIYDLTDGSTHHVLQVIDGEVMFWRNVSPTEAYYKQSQLLQRAEAKDRRLSLEAVPEDMQAPFKRLRVLRPTSALKEQLDSVIPSLPASDRLGCTHDMVASWLQTVALPDASFVQMSC